ncbi:multidrug transporter [Halomonas salipaludis]|uniref:Multidrug transporter n=2 Tax=Halomonas salipaludis TaxID=2032625 RepID=A0A2A2EUX9_9GAMM|nr:multidrug transporter [Halomonas salipaludis]
MLVLVAWYVVTDRLAPYSSRGAVSGYLAQLTPRVAGQVTEVFVQDGEVVEAGRPLFRLDTRPFELAVRRAEADLAQAMQATEASAASIMASQAVVTQARVELENVRASTNRILSLARRDLVAQVDADNARAELRSAQAGVARAEADLESAMLALGERGLDNPEVLAAQVRLEQAQLDLELATVTAPTRGAVTNLQLAVGTYVSPGTPAITFFDARGAWITADLRENQLGNVTPGDRVAILFDAVPGRVFEGRVQSIAWGIDPGRPTTGGLMQNQPANEWFEPARRMPVHIELEGGLEAWPRAVRAGGKVSVVVFAQGRDNPVAWLSSALLRLRAWLSYLY